MRSVQGDLIQLRGMNIETDGSCEVVASNIPLKMSGTPLKIERSFPAIGQHNEEVYCDLLGYSREDLTRLREEGVI